MKILNSLLDIICDNHTIEYNFLFKYFKVVLRLFYKFHDLVVIGPVQAAWVNCVANRGGYSTVFNSKIFSMIQPTTTKIFYKFRLLELSLEHLTKITLELFKKNAKDDKLAKKFALFKEENRNY